MPCKMTFECFTFNQQQTMLVIMFFTLSFAGVELHRGDYVIITSVSWSKLSYPNYVLRRRKQAPQFSQLFKLLRNLWDGEQHEDYGTNRRNCDFALHCWLFVPGNSHLDPATRLQIADRFLCILISSYLGFYRLLYSWIGDVQQWWAIPCRARAAQGHLGSQNQGSPKGRRRHLRV